MKVDVLLGLQWGDEGKGKIVDVLTPKYDLIARFQGGPNAGHTLEFNGKKHVLHTIPSGIFRDHARNLIGNGVVIDPIVLQQEIEALEADGLDVSERLLISRKAHLILPTHRMLDAASEKSKGKQKIGSTLRGIGPTYMDKTGRNGLRMGDTQAPNFDERYQALRKKHLELLRNFSFDTDGLQELEERWMQSIAFLKRFALVDSEHYINQALLEGKKVLAEGAQGSMLDIDFGSYPYVTSSNTICAGACTGLGIAPSRIGEVYGIFKAYCTRVGSGPFPTELFDENGSKLAKQGNEFGATTGRPRRCGWLDLPALKYATLLNGVTQLIMTKADVLSEFPGIDVCTHYRYQDEVIDYYPYDVYHNPVEALYTSLSGWNQDLTSVTHISQFPQELNDYIAFLEHELKIPLHIISVGPDREQTLVRP